jgi:hypothetical protein
MKSHLVGFVTGLFLVFALHGQSRNVPAESNPRFEDFPVASSFHGKPASPVFPKGRPFPPEIQEAARKGPNFAGHYTIAEWGCGSGCVSFAIMDAISGRVNYPTPFVGLTIPYRGAANGRQYDGLQYRLDSSLFIADGCLEDPVTDDSSKVDIDCGTKYYKWERNRFVLILSVPAPARK